MKLKTNNLVLRTVNSEDLNEVARMWNFEKGEISLDEAQKAIDWMRGNHEKNQPGKIVHICYAIFEKDKNRIIGWCGLDGRSSNEEDGNTVKIFYLIDENYRKQGYGTECGNKVLEYGFEIMKVGRIDGQCAKDNIGSQKILEKIGMEQLSEETEDCKEYDSLHYFMTIRDYTSLYNK